MTHSLDEQIPEMLAHDIQATSSSSVNRYKTVGLYGFGVLNFLHGMSHLAYAVPSFLLASEGFTAHGNTSSHTHACSSHEGCASSGSSMLGSYADVVDSLVHNPYMGLVWAGIGVAAVGIAYIDSRKHKNREAYISHLEQEINRITQVSE